MRLWPKSFVPAIFRPFSDPNAISVPRRNLETSVAQRNLHNPILRIRVHRPVERP